MSYVVAAPEFVVAAAHDLATIGSNLSVANATAVVPTSGVMAAGADEVSTTIAALFGAHAQAYQALSAQAALFHQQFVQLMTGGAVQYAMTEAANASPLDAAQPGALGATPAASMAAGMPAATTTPAPTPAAAMGAAPPAASLHTPVALASAGAPAATAQAAAVPSMAGTAPMAMAARTPIGATASACSAGSAVAAAEPAGAPVEAAAAESAEFASAPSSALPLSAGTPLGAAPATRAYTPATPAYSPAPAVPAEEQPAE